MLLGLTRHVATKLNKIETRVPGFGFVGVVTLRPAAALVTECTRAGKSLQLTRGMSGCVRELAGIDRCARRV